MTNNKFHLNDFSVVLVNKQEPKEVFLATVFNPKGLEYEQTIFRDVVLATERTVELNFNGDKPEFEPGVDAIARRKDGNHLIMRSGNYFALTLGSKVGHVMTAEQVENDFDVLDQFTFNSYGLNYRVESIDGALKALYHNPSDTKVDARESYIPLHNLFSHQSAKLELN